MAAVKPSIASPGPAPVAPCPGPPPAALRLRRLLLNRSGQLFSGCSRGPADPAPGPAHFGPAHYILWIRPPPAPARGRMDRWRKLERQRGSGAQASGWRPGERTKRLRDFESSPPPPAERPPRSLLPPRNHVLQDGSAQVLTTQDRAGSLLPPPPPLTVTRGRRFPIHNIKSSSSEGWGQLEFKVTCSCGGTI